MKFSIATVAIVVAALASAAAAGVPNRLGRRSPFPHNKGGEAALDRDDTPAGEIDHFRMLLKEECRKDYKGYCEKVSKLKASKDPTTKAHHKKFQYYCEKKEIASKCCQCPPHH
ncbi:hypothetical protein SYNPS1DRAFT_21117 [Syncephalis pseudoplumigaleata]|uniref:Uncharacterized protein n=1 Tax=Syncephalis pseudoplumigaleata TaxID=1712513 RepID=A0A4P9Z4A3_9FUNG|nr:hypothetical protein SYNPS1DRAFT_21117 [Syncephalis pseudoplumigaleata]|eukprot:RKP27326.1 hypothetical protein SYNPS1DRAFT_21117 [Syncephalis pseudoplumigaleata]